MSAATDLVSELHKMAESVRDLKDYVQSIHTLLATVELRVHVLHNQMHSNLHSVRFAERHEEPMYIFTSTPQELNRDRIGGEAVRILADMVMNEVASAASLREPLVDDPLFFACHFRYPFTSEKLARAYSMVRCKKVNAKVMLRTMRDMLVLLVCCCETSGGPWSNERLTEEIKCVFNTYKHARSTSSRF